MTNDEIFDGYAGAMLTGIGSRLAEMAIGGSVEPAVIAAMIRAGMMAAKAAYDMRNDYKPDET